MIPSQQHARISQAGWTPASLERPTAATKLHAEPRITRIAPIGFVGLHLSFVRFVEFVVSKKAREENKMLRFCNAGVTDLRFAATAAVARRVFILLEALSHSARATQEGRNGTCRLVDGLKALPNTIALHLERADGLVCLTETVSGPTPCRLS
jgi:hypothetical protein